MVSTAVNSTASLILLIFLGFLMGGTDVMKEQQGDKLLAYILANWALPIFVFYNVYSSFSGRNEILALVVNLPIPFLAIGLMLSIGATAGALLRIDRYRRGAFICANAFANTSFIGFPIITTLFGSQALAVGMMYYIANTLLFFSAGACLLSLDSQEKAHISTKETLKKIFSPMVIGLLLGLAAKLANLKLPAFVCSAMSYFNSVCPCLGMIFVGIVIRKNRIGREYIPTMAELLCLRYLITPFAVGFMLRVLPVENEIKAIFFILAMMPSVTQMSIMSQVYGSDSAFCAVWLTVSSVFGVAYIPVLVLLAEKVFHFI